jgi:hypothetical protein
MLRPDSIHEIKVDPLPLLLSLSYAVCNKADCHQSRRPRNASCVSVALTELLTECQQLIPSAVVSCAR